MASDFMVGAAEFSSVLAELGMSEQCDRERMFKEIGKLGARH
jgi:hypothetical protein